MVKKYDIMVEEIREYAKKHPKIKEELRNGFVYIKGESSGSHSKDELLKLVNKTITDRYLKDPEQCWIKSMIARGKVFIERYNLTKNRDQLIQGIDEILVNLIYGSMEHKLAFHDKWNKVGRVRNDHHEVKKFRKLLDSREFQNNLVALFKEYHFKSEYSVVRKYIETLPKKSGFEEGSLELFLDHINSVFKY